MSLKNGTYRTAAGSEMRVSGLRSGVSAVNFDWVEEGACVDCQPNVYDDDGYLVWDCDDCGGGKAKLEPFMPMPEGDHAL